MPPALGSGMKLTLLLVAIALLSLSGLTGCFGTYHDACYDGCVSSYPAYGTSTVVVDGRTHHRHGGHAAVRASTSSHRGAARASHRAASPSVSHRAASPSVSHSRASHSPSRGKASVSRSHARRK